MTRDELKDIIKECTNEILNEGFLFGNKKKEENKKEKYKYEIEMIQDAKKLIESKDWTGHYYTDSYAIAIYLGKFSDSKIKSIMNNNSKKSFENIFPKNMFDDEDYYDMIYDDFKDNFKLKSENDKSIASLYEDSTLFGFNTNKFYIKNTFYTISELRAEGERLLKTERYKEALSELEAVKESTDILSESTNEATISKFKADCKKLAQDASNKFGVNCKFIDFKTDKKKALVIELIGDKNMTYDKDYNKFCKISDYISGNYEKICNKYNLDWNADDSAEDHNFFIKCYINLK